MPQRPARPTLAAAGLSLALALADAAPPPLPAWAPPAGPAAPPSLPAAAAAARISFGVLPPRRYRPAARRRVGFRPAAAEGSGEAASSPPPEADASPDAAAMSVPDATRVLTDFDSSQQSYMAEDGMKGMGGGGSALSFLRSLSPERREEVQVAVRALVDQALSEREGRERSAVAGDGGAGGVPSGRVMLGICASNAPEALAGLKSWVGELGLPRGKLHGMDVDGVPIPPEELGSVYVKFSTGGAMTFTEMRRTGIGFDALWRPGDALLEGYDGDFRGVYMNVELRDGEFRQFGVLPTDLFMDLDEGW